MKSSIDSINQTPTPVVVNSDFLVGQERALRLADLGVTEVVFSDRLLAKRFRALQAHRQSKLALEKMLSHV